MKYKYFWLGIAIFSVAIFAPSHPGLAQNRSASCPNTQVTPAKENREIQNQEFGFRFDIPANYSTERSRDGDKLNIFLRNPADVELLECCRKRRQIGCGHLVSDVIVSAEIPRRISMLRDVVPVNSNTNQVLNIRETYIANQQAVIYTVQTIYPEKHIYASFFTPDRRYLITVHTGDYGDRIDPLDESVFNRVISSFVFDR